MREVSRTSPVGLLEFHQFDQVVRAGLVAAHALLDEAGPDLFVTHLESTADQLDPGTPALA
jgi:hypothetical protein